MADTLIENISVEYSSANYAQRLSENLKEYGVAVLHGVFSGEECDQHMSAILDGFKKVSPSLKLDTLEEIKATWIDRDLMPQTRKGLFQRGYASLAWPIRQDPRMSDLFKQLYTELRGEPVEELISSIDGINIRPPIGPFFEGPSPQKDWAHVDQTGSVDPFQCVQSQVVLTNTSAAFRCSPKSHLLIESLLMKFNKLGARSNFFRMPQKEIPLLQKQVTELGGVWQIPIHVPKGSMIFWLSSTIHSAKLADPFVGQLTELDSEDRWKHWRGIVYVCLRPKHEIPQKQFELLKKVYQLNLTTNHWGDTAFDKTPMGYKPANFSKRIQRFTSHPDQLYSLLCPDLSPLGKQLLGL